MKVTKAVIPVAGLATRFLPITKSIPKEILPIGGFPVIHWVVSELIASGIQQILFVTSMRNQVIERYFSHDPWLEEELIRRGKIDSLSEINHLLEQCTFFYVYQTKPAGIADAILLAKDFVGDDSFFCHMGDSFFCSSEICKKMIDMHEKYHASCTIAVRDMEIAQVTKKSYAVFNGNIEKGVFDFTQVIEKPMQHEVLKNTGVIGRYIFIPEIFSIIEDKNKKNELISERDFSKVFDILLKYGLGIAINSRKELQFYEAGDVKEYSDSFRRFSRKAD